MQRVLIVEDNENNMKLITFILEKGGYTVMQAWNGREAIDAARKQKPDFIILDIQLPDMNGMDVLAELRSNGNFDDVPFIAMTSFASGGDRKKILNGGCDGYIEKPIDPARVLDQIKQILGE